MPIDTITLAYQLPKTEDEPVDVDAIETDLNTDFDKMPYIRKETSMTYMRDQERNILGNHLNGTLRLKARI